MLIASGKLTDVVEGKERPSSRRGGTAAVEFAVCLPWIMFLLFGIWEVGRMVEVSQVMWGACREGARQASTGTEDLHGPPTCFLPDERRAERLQHPGCHNDYTHQDHRIE